MQVDEQKLDELLERGLRECSQVEPRSGLEERVLANLRAQPEPRAWWRVWVPALAAAALIVMVAVVSLRTEKPQAQRAQTVPAATISQEASKAGEKTAKGAAGQPAVAPDVLPQQQSAQRVAAPVGMHPRDTSRRAQRVESRAAQPALPRQAVFPSPMPLTEQEQLVLALVRHAPHEVVQVAKEQEVQRVRTAYYLQTGNFPEDSGKSK